METNNLETRLEDLDKFKVELILDYCSSKLWKEFKKGSKLPKEQLDILRDMFMSNQNYECHQELQKKLHCTRFFCGLSESRIYSNDGSVTYQLIHPSSISHAKEICRMYPFSSTEQQHFISLIKVQVVLSAYRAGKTDKALKYFTDLYDEKADQEQEYQEDLRDFFHSPNEMLQTKTLKQFSYDKFLRQVYDFLKPVFCKYDVPFLEKVEENLEFVDKHSIPCSFIQIYHDNKVPDDKDMEASWDSIIRGTHPDITEFKTNLYLRIKRKKRHSKDKVDPLLEGEHDKTKNVISKLKESSKELQDFIDERNKEKPKNERQKAISQCNLNKKWNEPQEEAVVIEWLESDEELDNRPSIRLCTPKRSLNVSFQRPLKRQKRNPWSDEELNWLCKGVETYGEGKWSVILRMFPFGSSRTSVDLKDKWRNYCKNF